MIKRIFYYSILLFPVLSQAFDLGMVMGPPSRQKNIIRLSGTLQPKANFSNQGNETKAGVQQESLNLNIPIYREENNGFTMNAGYQRLNIFPNQPAVPDLYDVHFGGSYSHIVESGKMLSVSAKYGSASDRPFKDSSVSTINGTILYSYSNNPKSSWLWLLNYSNNRPVLNNIPMPGFAYNYTPSKTFRATFGIPFASIFWQFSEQWSVTSFIIAPWVLKTSLAFNLNERMKLLIGIDFSQMTYLKYNRVNKRDRIYYDEMKVFTGLKSPISNIFTGEFEAGYSFNRSIFSAKSYTRSPENPIKIASGPYGKLSITATF